MFRQACRFYLSHLMTRKSQKDLVLDISILPKMPHNEKASCECLEENIPRPKRFAIDIKKASMREMLKSLAHEIVHVKQYATGELKDYVHADNICRWQGEILEAGPGDAYWEFPWEIEAFGREVGLYYLFRKHLQQVVKKEPQSKKKQL